MSARPDVVIIAAELAAALEVVPRDEQCTVTVGCLLRAGHEGRHFETARITSAPNYGPNRKDK